MVTQVQFVEVRTRNTTEVKQLLEPEDYKPGMSVADLIRLCHTKHPKESNGSISRFITAFTGKFVRTQWVYNVLHQELKRK